MTGFVEELAQRVLRGAPPAVVGLDPRLDALPQALLPSGSARQRIVAFYGQALPVLARHVPCVKPNVAFFEQHGADGFRAYEETCALAKTNGLLVVGDVKRGDIGPTAEAYAEGHFRHADALTLHPYLGRDSLDPFLAWCGGRDGKKNGKAVFVLVRTSNRGAKDLQDLQLMGRGRLCEAVAAMVAVAAAELPKSEGYSPVGAVVGATWPDELALLRAAMPQSWLLLPGVGAQGGKTSDLAPAFDRRGLGALVTQSRGVMQTFAPQDPRWLDAIDGAAAAFAAECRAVAKRTAPANGTAAP